MAIYSATQFFNELDLLEIRLETMSPEVDFFIISESTKTHSGKDKPLYYLENRERFKKFQDKIVHQVIDDTPSSPQELFSRSPKNELHEKAIFSAFGATWFDKNIESYLRDTYEKECLIIPLENCSPDDIILLGDLDEVVSHQKIAWLKSNFDKSQTYHFKNEMFYYYLNLQKLNEPWSGTLAMSFKEFQNKSFCEARTYKQGIFIEDGGWHFTSVGSIEHIKTKIESWGEQSLNIPSVKDSLEENVKNCLSNGHDLFFRPANFVKRDIEDGTFPLFISENREKFKEIIL